MKDLKRILLALVIGAFMINLMAWSNGNTNFYTFTIEENVSLSDIKDPDIDRRYFRETVIEETVYPSGFPLLFESKIDTIKTSLKSREK
jgi:hypothetical protein